MQVQALNDVTKRFDVDLESGGGGSGGDFAGLVEGTITEAIDSTVTTIRSGAFAWCKNLTTASFPECTTIELSAFGNCNSLTTVNFPKCLSISYDAFCKCGNLTTVSFPVCTDIAAEAFYMCGNLTTAIFPSCKTIDVRAFCDCHNLATVSFPECSQIGSSAFISCFNLKSAYFLSNSVPSLGNGSSVFEGTPSSASFFVRASLLTDFKVANGWSYFSSRIVGLTDEEIAALDNE